MKSKKKKKAPKWSFNFALFKGEKKKGVNKNGVHHQ